MLKYLEGLPNEQKYSYREPTRIYERSNLNKDECEDLFIQFFDHFEQTKAYRSVIIEWKITNQLEFEVI